MSPPANEPGSFESLRSGWRALLAASPLHKLLTALGIVLTLLMLPIGRTAPGDGGGALAPLTVDSGYLFRTRPAADFFSVYDAGSRILAGRDPYGVNIDQGRGLRAPYVATFRYLPITAFLLAVPLNILPPWPAFYAWSFINVAMLGANFLLCVGRRPEALLPFVLLWFGWFPIIAELHMGQFSLLMATLLLWGVDAMRTGKGWGHWAWLGATLIKVYTIAMAPALFLWGRRGPILAALVLVFLTTLVWQAFIPSAMREGLINRGIGGRVIGTMRIPYAGAQGTQEAVNAIVWKASGRSFDPSPGFEPPVAADPVYLVNGFVLCLYGLVCLWALVRSRRAFSLPALGLFWMTWFVAYRDCWEHHYILLQSLIGILVAWRVIGARALCILWLFAGAPSVWYFWRHAGYSGNAPAELLGLLYFLQRPVAVVMLTVLCVRALVRETRP